MSIKELIHNQVNNLSENDQKKVLELICSLQQKSDVSEAREWNKFSLEQAMKGLENETFPEYTEADLIEKWQ
ncbi:MAG: hypothetical protein ACXITR_07755 [Cyanobacterium sp.]